MAEEWGGVRTAYHYDLLVRQEMAKALECGEAGLTKYLTKLDRDVLGDAKRKVDIKAQEAGRDAARCLMPPLINKCLRIYSSHSPVDR